MPAHFPGHDPRVDSLTRRIRELEHEVELLKQRPRSDFNPPQHRSEITFSFHGPVVLNDKSGAYQVKDHVASIRRVDWNAYKLDPPDPSPDPDPGTDDPGPIGGGG